MTIFGWMFNLNFCLNSAWYSEIEIHTGYMGIKSELLNF